MKRIHKESLKEALKAWAEKYRVIAPRLTERDERIFDTFDEAWFTLDYAKPSLPLKHALFPQSEAVFRVDQGIYRQIIREEPALLFGIRSCDLKGMLQSLSFMTKDFDDRFYTLRAKNTAAIVMACPGSRAPPVSAPPPEADPGPTGASISSSMKTGLVPGGDRFVKGRSCIF